MASTGAVGNPAGSSFATKLRQRRDQQCNTTTDATSLSERSERRDQLLEEEHAPEGLTTFRSVGSPAGYLLADATNRQMQQNRTPLAVASKAVEVYPAQQISVPPESEHMTQQNQQP